MDSKRIPKGFKKDSKGFKNIPKNSNCSSADQKILKDSKRFQKIKRDSENSKEVQKTHRQRNFTQKV